MTSTTPGSQPNEADTNQTYKDQLDQTAQKVKYGTQDGSGGIASQVAEKVSQYVPAVGKVLGTDKKKNPDDSNYSSANISGPPDRPHHDTQIEEFVRDQHRSKTQEGTLASE